MPAIHPVLHMVRSFLTPVKSILRPSLVAFPFGLYFYNAQFVRMEATKSAIGDTTWNGLWLKWTYHPPRCRTKTMVVQPLIHYRQEMSRTTTTHSPSIIDQASPTQLGYCKLVNSLGILVRLDVDTIVGPLPGCLSEMAIDTLIDWQHLRVLYWQDREIYFVSESMLSIHFNITGCYKTTE